MTMTNTATIDRGTAHSAPAPAPEKLMALENLWRHAQGTLRDLPSHVVLDCLVSLHMDHASRTNVAQLLGVHADKFERMAKAWGLAGAREFAA